MFSGNHGLAMSQVNGDVWTDHILGHEEDRLLSAPARCKRLPQRTGRPSLLTSKFFDLHAAPGAADEDVSATGMLSKK
jgi:hypothetical protein